MTQTEPTRAHPPLATRQVRERAERLGVDLATIRGSGIAGRVTAADLEAVAPAAGEAEQPSTNGAEHWATPPSMGRSAATPAARALAAAEKISLDDVRGSGPGGHVHVRDLVGRPWPTSPPMPPPARPAVPTTPQVSAPPEVATPSARPAPGGSTTAVAELDLTPHLPAGATDAEAALAAVQTALAATLPGLTGVRAPVVVLAAEDILLDIPTLPAGAPAQLSVGRPVRRSVVTPAPGGGELLAVRTLTLVALRYDEETLSRPRAAELLAGVRRALAT